MIVHLVTAGDGRYDIESMPADTHRADEVPGFWARKAVRARERWAHAVHEAQHAPQETVWARWRGRLICHLNESVEEQRSLWALRDRSAATLVHPSSLSRDQAYEIL